MGKPVTQGGFGLRARAYRAVAASLTAVLLLAVGVAFAPSAGAAGGTWGVGKYPYLDGVVCPSGLISSTPFVSWDVGGGTPGFLLAKLSSGLVDSGAPPLASQGAQSTTNLTAGQYSFGSAAEIATYAALLSKYGSSDSTRVAEVAYAVMSKASGAPAACFNTGGLSALLADAAASAGPYAVTVTSNPGPIAKGTSVAVTATVKNVNGGPAPGVNVKFSTDSGQFSADTAATDANGVAQVQLTVPVALTSPAANISASAAVSLGLSLVSASGTPSISNPTGSIVPALVPNAAQSTTGTLAIPIDQTAKPVLKAGAAQGLVVGQPFTPTVNLSGMNGHSGSVTFTLYGPQPATAGSFCANVTNWNASSTVAQSSSVPTSGDLNVAGASFAPTQPGCYYVRAAVTTTDSTPQATADTGFATRNTVTVLAAVATLSLPQTLVGQGPVSANVVVTGTQGAAGSVNALLVGPDNTMRTDCAGVDWSSEPKSATVVAPISGDGTTTITTAPVAGNGCLQIQGNVSLNAGGVAVSVPIAQPTDGRSLIAIAPIVTQHVQQVWSNTPSTVPTTVSVYGTYGQHGKLSVQMMYMPPDELGCSHADWSKATVASVGSLVPTTGDSVDISVPSGPTPKIGCYVPVAKLVMDSNTSIVVSSALDARYNALIAAPAAGGNAANDGAGAVAKQSWVRWGIVLGVVGLLILAALGGTALLVVRSRREAGQDALAAPKNLPTFVGAALD